ncbi:MAG: F0F1 ATP synthase subunit alpha, partial [Phycisphaerales bacterium]|nr:F0F1 ATP synthase subunit alpha [Phycisphaerales bacterium]
KGALDSLPLDQVHAFERDLLDYFQGSGRDLRAKLEEQKSFKQLGEEFEKAIKDFKSTWSPPA